jgi:hypothetical protein
MNKKNREQLRASIARDLSQGQGEHSPTRELLKQYAPLEGVIAAPASDSALQLRPVTVEKTMAPHATVAQNEAPAERNATVAPDAKVAGDATLEQYAVVKGELRVPNTINFSLFPTLDPFAKAVYYQLFLLSHGFRRDTCIVGLSKLAKSVVMSQRKLQETINCLEKRGLIKRLRAILGGPSKGNVYRVMIPATDAASGSTVVGNSTVANDATTASDATLAPHATVAQRATNKYDDDIKIKSSSKGEKFGVDADPVGNHSAAAAPRERKENADERFLLVRAAYEKATGNRWSAADSEAYHQNGIGKVPTTRILASLEAVVRRTPTKINSFRYFVKEILALPDPRNRAWQKKRLEKIVHRVRDNNLGGRKCSMANFVEDVKCACAREGVTFDNDTFNELVG